MKKIIFITLYDVICSGVRLLSAIAENEGVDTSLIFFKDQKTKAIYKDSKAYGTYQFYVDGVKYGSCYAAYPYTEKEIDLLALLVKKIAPDLICLSTRTFGYTASKEIIDRIREKNIDTLVVAGGWGPTLEPQRFLEFCDYVCFGEGEKPFREICCHIKDDNYDLRKISNLIYTGVDGSIIRNDLLIPVSNEEFNKLPFPDYKIENKYLIDNNKVKTGRNFYNEKMYNCFASRGCPLNCSYCLSGRYRELYSSYGGHNIKKCRTREVTSVIKELKRAKDSGALFIKMNDEVFPMDKKWVKEFIELYGEEVKIPFFAYIRPEFHSDKTIEDMARVGLSTTVIGIQSGSEFIRKKIFKRSFSNNNLKLFANILRQHDVDFCYHLINYNPFEKEEHLSETFNLLCNLPFGSLLIFRLVPQPGTPISKMIQEENPYPLPDITQKRYSYLFTMATRSFYYRKLGIFIFRKNMFKNTLIPFYILFSYSFIELIILKITRKLLFGSSTLLKMPSNKK